MTGQGSPCSSSWPGHVSWQQPSLAVQLQQLTFDVHLHSICWPETLPATPAWAHNLRPQLPGSRDRSQPCSKHNQFPSLVGGRCMILKCCAPDTPRGPTPAAPPTTLTLTWHSATLCSHRPMNNSRFPAVDEFATISADTIQKACESLYSACQPQG